MNYLQEFMAECNRQTRTADAAGKVISQEEVTINGSVYFGTFAQVQVESTMERHGYEDSVAFTFTSAAEQYTTPPQPRQMLKRNINNVEYFIQSVDNKNPLLFTFVLVDREP